MRAIRPIYDNRISLEEMGTLNSLDSIQIRKCLYSIIHQKFQTMSANKVKELEERLRDEEKKWGGRSVWYTDILAVLYEIKEWSKDSGIKLDIIANDNMHEHMKVLDLFNAFTIGTDLEQLKERVLIYTTPEGFWELLCLLEVHWANIMLDWDLDYDFDDELGTFGRIIFGPVIVKIYPDWSWDTCDEKLYQEIYGKLGMEDN